MFDAIFTFVYSVLGFYIFYRYHQHYSVEYEGLTWAHFKWSLFFFILFLMVIHTSHRVLSEVIITISFIVNFNANIAAEKNIFFV